MRFGDVEVRRRKRRDVFDIGGLDKKPPMLLCSHDNSGVLSGGLEHGLWLESTQSRICS